LPVTTLVNFSKKSGLTLAEISRVLRIPARTLARRKARGKMTPLESERLARLAGLFDGAVVLLSPLVLAETEQGARAVVDLIGQLECDVYP
jgi:uncharacterized protein (DUF2384 family)